MSTGGPVVDAILSTLTAWDVAGPDRVLDDPARQHLAEDIARSIQEPLLARMTKTMQDALS